MKTIESFGAIRPFPTDIVHYLTLIVLQIAISNSKSWFEYTNVKIVSQFPTKERNDGVEPIWNTLVN